MSNLETVAGKLLCPSCNRPTIIVGGIVAFFAQHSVALYATCVTCEDTFTIAFDADELGTTLLIEPAVNTDG